MCCLTAGEDGEYWCFVGGQRRRARGPDIPQLLWTLLARRSGFQCNPVPLLRPFVSEHAEGNPDLSFSFSRFCSQIRNNGRNTNAAGISVSPIEGAFGGVDGGAACECASRVDAIHGADARGSGSMEAGVDDNLHYDLRKLFKEAGHNGDYQPTLPIFSLATPGHRRKPSAWVNCRGWQGETKTN